MRDANRTSLRRRLAVCGVALAFAALRLPAVLHAAGHALLSIHAHAHDGEAHSHGHDGDAHHHEVARTDESPACLTAAPILVRPASHAQTLSPPASNAFASAPAGLKAALDTGPPPRASSPLLSREPADRAPPA